MELSAKSLSTTKPLKQPAQVAKNGRIFKLCILSIVIELDPPTAWCGCGSWAMGRPWPETL
jgi:hypothetical protein